MMATVTKDRQKCVLQMYYTSQHSLNPAFTNINYKLMKLH